jgi:alkylation response protein AidB-like acyl-CoA dehydrogenase
MRISDIIMRWKSTRTNVYYAAYCWDLGRDITVDASMVKAMGAEATMASANDAVQIMAGTALTAGIPFRTSSKWPKPTSSPAELSRPAVSLSTAPERR